MTDSQFALPSMIPNDTVQAASQSFPSENFYIKVGDLLEMLVQGKSRDLLERPLNEVGLPAYVLALATIFQYLENLTDDEMAVKLRRRADLRYGMHLPLRNPTITSANLCQYRQILLGEPTSHLIFDDLANRIQEMTTADKKLETLLCEPYPVSIPEQICLHNRAEVIIAGMLNALGALAAHHPEWLRQIAPPYWYERYNRSSSKFIKKSIEKNAVELAITIGSDIKLLLDCSQQEPAVVCLAELTTLKQVFFDNYQMTEGTFRFELRPINCALCPRAKIQTKEAVKTR